MIKDDMAKSWKDKKSGTIWWKLLKYRTKIPEPPSDCIDISNKGKKLAEYFKTDDGQFIPIKVDFDYEKFKKGDPIEKIAPFRPYNNNQRSMLVQEHREAEAYKKKNISDLLVQLAPLLAIIMILVAFMLFFGEVVAPTKDFANQLTNNAEKCRHIAKQTILETKEKMGINPVWKI